MKLASLIMAGAVALAGTAAFAQNEAPNSTRGAGAGVTESGRQMGQDAKEAGHKVGDAVKRGWDKLRGQSHDAKETAKAKADDHKDRTAKSDRDMKKDDTRTMGAGRDMSRDIDMSNDASRRQRMDDAYANYKKGADTRK